MALMVVPGIVAVVFGVMLLCVPMWIHRWNEVASRPLGQLDPVVLKYRFGVGLSLFTVGLFCFASAYYVWLRLHQG